MSSKEIDKNFIILENGLYCCKVCNGTYENEYECLQHLKEVGCDWEDVK